MADSREAAEALEWVRRQAAASRVNYSEKALAEARVFNDSLDLEDLRQSLCGAIETDIMSYEPDERRAEKMVLILRLSVVGKSCYCKLSLRPGWDRTVTLLSFHEWQ